jgi:mannopine transport system substrate-binding protein
MQRTQSSYKRATIAGMTCVHWLWCAALLAQISALVVPSVARAQGTVVVVTTGGVYEQAMKDAWFEPFTKATGVTVTTVTATDAEARTRAQAMASAGNPTWDIIINADVFAGSPQNRAFSVDMTEFCQQFSSRKDLIEKACNPSGVQIALGATLLAFDPRKYQDKKPSTWADLWDVQSFPGPRALPSLSDPWRVYAAALMADGVPADKLFPLDIERAIKKLDQIKPHVQLWWKSGDQIQQGFRNGEYTIGMIWGTRANALKDEGRPIEVSFDGAFMVADTMQVLRGSPNPAGALELLKYYLNNPSAQARFTERFSITPPSLDAIPLMSESARTKIPTSPTIFRKLVQHDTKWINANQARMLDIWNDWIQR